MQASVGTEGPDVASAALRFYFRASPLPTGYLRCHGAAGVGAGPREREVTVETEVMTAGFPWDF